MPIRYHSAINRQKLAQQYAKREKDPLLDLDTKVRAALTTHRDRCFKDDWWPRQGSEDEALLITYGLGEFTQGILEEEDRFIKDWLEGR
jgi:hypothetical protein